MKKTIILTVLLLLIGFTLPGAEALTFSEWGFTPFSDWEPNFGYYVVGNNTSPICYPHGVGNAPSPGGIIGEEYDIEALYYEYSGDYLNIALVTSYGDAVYNDYWGRWYHAGDLALDFDADGDYDFGVKATDYGLGSKGDIYSNVGWRSILTGHGGYGGDPDIEPLASPFLVDSGTYLGTVDFWRINRDYDVKEGFDENGTNIWGWSIDKSFFRDVDFNNMRIHTTLECGNDVINGVAPVPEPSTLILLGTGLIGLGFMRRMRRNINRG